MRRPRSPLCLLALALLTGCGGAWPIPAAKAPAREVIATADGWRLTLHRLEPPAGVPRRGSPVIVCHGVASNRFNFDITPAASLPRALAAAGWTVYLLELRGGASSQPPAGEDPWRYTFDDYVLRDLPAAIEAVAARSPSGQVHWVGHSMGGMVLYGYLQRVGNARLRSATAIGSPPYAPSHLATLRDLSALWPPVAALFDRIPSGRLGPLSAPVAAPARHPAQHLLWNPDNLDPEVARRLAAHATEDISARAFGQIVASGAGRLLSADGGWDYTAGLARITAPLLLIAGAADGLAPPALLYEVYGRLASPDKRIEIMARANGHAHDYGHLDLVVGEAAPAEVFGLVQAWIAAHDDPTPREPPARMTHP